MAKHLEKKILAGFAKEVGFYLPQIREDLETFLADSTQRHTLEAAYRSLHTIHGASAMMGLAVLSHLTFYLGTVFAELLSGELALDEAWSGWLRQSALTMEQYIHGIVADDVEEARVLAAMVQPFRRLKGLPEAGDAAALAAVLSGQPARLETSTPIRLRSEAMIREGLGLPDEWVSPPTPALPVELRPDAVPQEPQDAPAPSTLPAIEEAREAIVARESQQPVAAWTKELLADDVAILPGKDDLQECLTPQEMAVAPPEASAESARLDHWLATIDQEIRYTSKPHAPVLPHSAAPPGERYVLFTLAETRYAIAVSSVLEISRVPAMTYVPNVPPWIRGVTNLRGEILSVIDGRMLLGMEASGQLEQSRLLVVQSRDNDLTTSLLVDQVHGMIHLDASRLEVPAVAVADKLTPYLQGVYDDNSRLLAVLDLERWLTSPEVRQFD